MTAEATRLSRRAFLRGIVALGAASAAGPLLTACGGGEEQPIDQASPGLERSPVASPTATAEGRAALSRVAFVKTDDRAEGVRRAVALLKPEGLRGSRVLLKPNLNSADPSPGSTHPDTLRALVEVLQEAGVGHITVGERSGFGQNTREVMERTGVFALSRELGFETLLFDEMDEGGWVKLEPEGSHWPHGFFVPRLLSEVDAVVQTCNLKTHRAGGHFTISLKNSVGLVARQVAGRGHDYMLDLHLSGGEGGNVPNPHQRHMIAEINVAYDPKLIVMDGLVAFTTGGPAVGTRVDSQVFLAASDRVALDAVGVALLRHWGTTPEVSRGPIFEQEQIARAVELDLGAGSPQEIELVTDDEASEEYAAAVRAVLDEG